MHYHYFTLEQRATLERRIRSLDEPTGRDHLLERLRSPDYGVCTRCGGDIAYVRLLQAPDTEHCAACAAEQ